MRILLVDNETIQLDKLEKLLADHQITKLHWRQPLDAAAKEADAIILSGGHGLSVDQHQAEYAAEIALVRSTNKPVIGICLGCELIAHAFGGRLQRLPHRAKGVKTIEVLVDAPMFRGLKRVEVYQSHRWAITQLSPVLIGLARSATGHEVIRHITKPVYGLQFHPEMLVSKTAGHAILHNLLNQFKQY